MFGRFVVNSGEKNEEVQDCKKVSDGDFEEKSCFFLKRTFFVRKWFIHLVHWPWFERLSMLVILVNCVCLALADPLDRSCEEMECKRLTKINSFVLYFFVAEMIIKMIAMGVIGKKSYFSEGWNRLDFLIVVAGIVDEFTEIDGAFLVMIRLVRVLRPLRAINRVPSIRILVTLLLEALPLLGNVFALAFLVLFIFSIIGVQLWQGVLRNRCFLNTTLLDNATFRDATSCYYQPSFEEPDFLCTLASDAGTKHCTDVKEEGHCIGSSYNNNDNYCERNESGPLSNEHFRCKQEGPNPFHATVSFDNIGSALVVIFQIITLEGWSDIMYRIQEAHDYWNWIYFVILILLGPFFLVNLCLVVLAMQFQETKSRELQLLEEDRKKKLEAANVFKQTKWGKVLSVVKTNLSESLHKRSDDQHVHHHHHFHHYYHHEHVVQSPRQNPEANTPQNPTFVVSHHSSVCHTPPVIHDPSGAEPPKNPTVLISHQSSVSQSPPVVSTLSQEPNDSIISLEMTSNCKISQNFLSPASPYSGRLSPTLSVKSSEQVCFSPDAVSLCSNEDQRKPSVSSPSTASASASVRVDVTTCQVHDEPKTKCAKTDVTATANASIKTQKAEKISTTTQKASQDEPSSRAASPKKKRNSNTVVFTPENKSSSDEVVKNKATSLNTLDVLSPGSRSSIKRNSFHTLDVSALDPQDSSCTELELPKLGAVYRKRSESFEEEDVSLKVPANGRRGTEGSLDDRFGSMFDIQRHGLYFVSQERTVWQRFREICANLANNATFINFIMIVILLNTVTMATEHYQQPQSLNEFGEISNLIFITIFSLEMIIKIAGEGIRLYLNQWFNIFDGFIVIISIIEVIIRQGSGGLSVLRSIRLLRIFRLIRPIRHQLIVMVHTMTSVVTFTALLFLFMFTFAVLGMNLFGGKFILPGPNCTMEEVRTNFDTFPAAMITIFQLLTLEDWNLVMQNAMRSTNHYAAIYFIILTIIGYYVLFNLLVAILVEGFTNPLLFEHRENDVIVEEKEDSKAKPTTDWLALIKQAKDQPVISEPSVEKDDLSDLSDSENDSSQIEKNFARTTLSAQPSYCGSAMRGVIGKPYKMDLRNAVKSPMKSDKFNSKAFHSTSKDKTELQRSLKSLRKPYDVVNKVVRNASTAIRASSKNSEGTRSSCFLRQAKRDHGLSRNNKGFSEEDKRSPVKPNPKIVITNEDGNERKMDERPHTASANMEDFVYLRSSNSLFIFSEENRFRRLLVRITASKLFDNFVLFLIVLSCGFMVFDDPTNINQRADVIYIANLVFTILFTIEVVIKVIAQGLILGKNTYLRFGWNILDLIIVIVSWLHVIISSFHSTSPGILGSVKVVRALRTLRPLRMIRRAPGLKLVVGALLRSLKPIGNTVLIAGIFFVVFGILGVQLFKGKFYHCDNDPDVKTRQECLGKSDGKWINRPYNFDNLAQALVTLFVLATRDGWVTVMHYGVDAVDIDYQPKQNHNQWRVLYFMSFLMVVGFLVLNMVVGIVVSNYQLCQEKQENADRKLKPPKTKEDLEIVDKTRYDDLGGLQPSSFRGRCFRLCHSKYWDLVIAFVIGVNVILMSLEHYRMSEKYKLLLEVNNYVCTGIFVIEAFVKLTAVGWRCYFYDRWNILDFMVVIFSTAGIILDRVHNENVSVKPIVLRSLRVLRIIRVLKLFKVAKGVRSLLDTVIKSLPQVANLGILLFLLFFIYSSLGIQLFGSIACSDSNPCHGLDSHAHFRNFPTAMLTLFRVATGDNWNTIFMDTLRAACDSSPTCQKNCCFSKYMAPLYFTTFVLATHFVLLNVLVAVLMKDLKASREKLAEVLMHETLEKRVLKLTLSATKFVKEKARLRRSKAPEEAVDGHIELKEMRRISLEPG